MTLSQAEAWFKDQLYVQFPGRRFDAPCPWLTESMKQACLTMITEAPLEEMQAST